MKPPLMSSYFYENLNLKMLSIYFYACRSNHSICSIIQVDYLKFKQNLINVYASYFLAITKKVVHPTPNFQSILNIDIIFKIKISLLAHKISQNEANIPEVFQNYLVKVSDIHSHNTRYASNLNFHVPRVRSNYGKHTFKFAITKTWEEIPTKIKTLSYHKFKKEYKRILVNSQR